MRVKTHMVFGILLALFVLDFRGTSSWTLYLIGAFLGAILPDVDHPKSYFNNKVPQILKPMTQVLSRTLKHRGVMHSIFPLIIIFAITLYWSSNSFLFGLFVGYLSHLLIDGFTVQGTNFLNPITTLRLSGFIETGTTSEVFLFVLLIVALILKIMRLMF